MTVIDEAIQTRAAAKAAKLEADTKAEADKKAAAEAEADKKARALAREEAKKLIDEEFPADKSEKDGEAKK